MGPVALTELNENGPQIVECPGYGRFVAQFAEQRQTSREQRPRSLVISAIVRDLTQINQRRGDTGLVTGELGDGEIFLEQGLRSAVVALADRDHPEVVQRPRDTTLIPDAARDFETLLMETRRRVPVALALCQNTGTVQRLGSHGGRHRGGLRQQRLQLIPPLGDVATQPPESPERATESQRLLDPPLVAQPVDGGAEVGLFPLEQVEPSCLLAPGE